jgi:hypothetical protein
VFLKLSASHLNTCGLDTSGQVTCWGDDSDGQVSDVPELDTGGVGDLVCTIDTESFDEDGDAITYTFEWDVDGTSYTDATTTSETGDTVPYDDYDGNETWTCTVTPNDGDEDGDSAEASITTEELCDADGDGYDSEDCGGLDCDDDDATVYPYAGDTYGDGVDGDCDGLDCEAASDGSTYFAACHADVNQSDALGECQDAGYTSLASILDSGEDSFAITLAQAVNDPADVNDMFWFGLYEYSSGWSWESGESASYWATWQEDNDGICARWVPHRSWLWGDANCSLLYNYVCEYR